MEMVDWRHLAGEMLKSWKAQMSSKTNEDTSKGHRSQPNRKTGASRITAIIEYKALNK